MANKGASTSRNDPSRVAASLLAAVVALQFGCGTVPLAPNTQHQPTLGKVAVVAISQETKIKFGGFARGKGEGAAKGAWNALVECPRSGGGCGNDPLCLAFLAVVCWIPAPVVGAVVGANVAPGAGEVRAAEGALDSNFDAKIIHELLRDEVVSAALAQRASVVSVLPETTRPAARLRDYSSLVAAGVDTVLEVSLTNVGAEGSGIDPLYLYMQAQVRLVRTSDNSEVFAADYIYQGEGLKLSEWSQDQAERLLRALRAGYETLGSHIYDNVFLIYPFPDRKPPLGLSSFGLGPIYPTISRSAPIHQDAPWLLRVLHPETTVDALQPTFRWEAFPRAADIATAPEEMARVRNVRYDLVIAQEKDLVPREIVYRREGLSDTVHTIRTTLSPATRYFWTVRARFELDGRLRVTEWSSMAPELNSLMRWPPRVALGVHPKSLQELESFFARFAAPSLWSYRFKTR